MKDFNKIIDKEILAVKSSIDILCSTTKNNIDFLCLNNKIPYTIITTLESSCSFIGGGKGTLREIQEMRKRNGVKVVINYPKH